MSNVIKPYGYSNLEDTKKIEIAKKIAPSSTDIQTIKTEQPEWDAELIKLEEMKINIMKEAHEKIETRKLAAEQEIILKKEQMNTEIEAWWSDRRAKDHLTVESAKQSGYNAGFDKGKLDAEQSVHQQYQMMLSQAQELIVQAHLVKKQIIMEAEPFLIDLSTAIAEKIIQHQLSVTPEWVVQLASKLLTRRREKGVITLCVAPSEFTYIHNMRDELLLSIDSQAELQIIPDPSVKDKGIVVRSTFGSIDARIQTQLDEIKNSLRMIVSGNEEME